jgi:glycosyltransferase involved in cell wall biosynthesis
MKKSTPKRVMIDGYNLDLEKGTGVSTYARTLSYALHELGYDVSILYGKMASPSIDKLMHEIAFFDSNAGEVPRWLALLRAARDSLLAPTGFYARRVPISGAVITRHFQGRLPYYDSIWNSPHLFGRAHNAFKLWRGLSKVYSGQSPDIMHWTYPVPIYAPSAANVYTLHDLVPLRLPYTTLEVKRRYFRMCRQIVKKAAHIVTVSDTSRQDIINLLGIDPARVTNTYQSVSIPERYANKPLDDVQREVEGTFRLRFKEYFLFYGAIEPKKNIGRLIEGYLASKVDTPLVIVGSPAWKSENELRLLADDHVRSLLTIGDETIVKRKVIRIEYVPFPLLVSLIRGAKSVLFPSLYEGFGLPVLESMLLGTPVLTSNVGATAEVAGAAAALVDPYDTMQICRGIQRLDSDPLYRSELTLLGQQQARKFSPESYHCRLEQVYERVLNTRRIWH